MIGIDPGLSGAIAYYAPAGPYKTPLLRFWEMPTHIFHKKREVNAYAVACILSEIPLEVPVIIEDVHSMPCQGVVSTFSFGVGFGMLLGVCASQNRHIYRIRPSVWKGLLGLSRDKMASILLANHTFGQDFGKKDGVAEAALLAKLGHDKFAEVQSARSKTELPIPKGEQ